MAAGEAIGCFGLTEPDFGSNPAGMRTARRRDGDDWMLNGTKMWITNGSIADVAIVWARTDDEGIRGFLVPTGTPGFTSPRDPAQAVAARVDHLRAGPRRRAGCPTTPCCPTCAACAARCRCLNEARFGIVWGVDGRRPGLLRDRPRLRQDPRASSTGRSPASS